MDRPITKFYIGDDVNVIAAEWRITKRRLTSFYNINFPNCNFQRLCKKINFTWGFYLFRFRQIHSMLFDSNNIYEWVHMAKIRGGGGGGGVLFQKLEKSAPTLGKDALIVVNYELNFSFEMQFLRVSRWKNQKFYPVGPLFLALYMVVYQSALIPRKLPCSKKFLVTRLNIVD